MANTNKLLHTAPLNEHILLNVPFQDSSLHEDSSQIDIGFAEETTLN